MSSLTRGQEVRLLKLIPQSQFLVVGLSGNTIFAQIAQEDSFEVPIELCSVHESIKNSVIWRDSLKNYYLTYLDYRVTKKFSLPDFGTVQYETFFSIFRDSINYIAVYKDKIQRSCMQFKNIYFQSLFSTNTHIHDQSECFTQLSKKNKLKINQVLLFHNQGIVSDKQLREIYFVQQMRRVEQLKQQCVDMVSLIKS